MALQGVPGDARRCGRRRTHAVNVTGHKTPSQGQAGLPHHLESPGINVGKLQTEFDQM